MAGIQRIEPIKRDIACKKFGVISFINHRLIAQKGKYFVYAMRIDIVIRAVDSYRRLGGRKGFQESSWSFGMGIPSEGEYKTRTPNNALNAVKLDIGSSGDSGASGL